MASRVEQETQVSSSKGIETHRRRIRSAEFGNRAAHPKSHSSRTCRTRPKTRTKTPHTRRPCRYKQLSGRNSYASEGTHSGSHPADVDALLAQVVAQLLRPLSWASTPKLKRLQRESWRPLLDQL